MQAILPSTQPRGSHAFHPAITGVVTPLINDNANDESRNKGAGPLPVLQQTTEVSGASGSHDADDQMSVDHIINMSLSPPPDATQATQLFPNASVSFPSSSGTSPASTPSHTPLTNFRSTSGSANLGSANSGKGKHKFLAAQDAASMTSSKKKASKHSTQATASNVMQGCCL